MRTEPLPEHDNSPTQAEASQQDPAKIISDRNTRHACILASAGSGKTRTLVRLIASDLANGVAPANIVAFTFTERAAEELEARVHAFLASNHPKISAIGMFIGTIHAWCLQYLLNKEPFRNFESIDELHLESLASRLYDHLGLTQAYGQGFPYGVERFLKDLDVMYNEDVSSDESTNPSVAQALQKMVGVLQDNRLLPFGAMICQTINYLQVDGPVRDLRRLYVDEYQDVNPAQVQLMKAMVPENCDIVAVGDDLQAIYQWRGGDVERILKFEDDFPRSSIYRIRENYRSRPNLVALANAVAAQVSRRDPQKAMIAIRQPVDVPVLHWLSLGSESEQAEAVAEIVQNFQHHGAQLGRMVVLLRSVSGSGQAIVDKLSERGVRVDCPILGRSGGFVTNFLLPVIEWLRTEHPEPRNQSDEQAAEAKMATLLGQISPWLPSGPNVEDRFWEHLSTWASLIEQGDSTAYDVRGRLYDFLNSCGVLIAPEDSSLMTGVGIASQIIRSVEEIQRRRIRRQLRRSARGVMNEVFFALVRNHVKFGESIPVETSSDRLLVTTVHQAKGLEWPIVILPMLNQGKFPVPERRQSTSFPDGITRRYGTTTDDELRLFYVAVTRARERIFLLDTAANTRDRTSVFLENLAGNGAISPTPFASIDTGVWQISRDDLKPVDIPPVNIGLSDLLIYADCPYQFALRRRVAIQPSIGEELGFGKGLHDVIRRRFESSKPWDGANIKTQVHTHTHLPYMSEGAEERSRKSIQESIAKLQTMGVFGGNVEAEVVVRVGFSSGIVHGVIDGIFTDKQGSVVLRDWKTNLHPEFVGRYEKQLQFYAYALRVQGRSVTRAELVDIHLSIINGQLATREVDVSERATNALAAELEQHLQDLASQRFPAKPGEVVCSSCDLRRICMVRHKSESPKRT